MLRTCALLGYIQARSAFSWSITFLGQAPLNTLAAFATVITSPFRIASLIEKTASAPKKKRHEELFPATKQVFHPELRPRREAQREKTLTKGASSSLDLHGCCLFLDKIEGSQLSGRCCRQHGQQPAVSPCLSDPASPGDRGRDKVLDGGWSAINDRKLS